MAFAEKNAPRFAKNNAKREQRLMDIAAMEARIEEKRRVLADLVAQIEVKTLSESNNQAQESPKDEDYTKKLQSSPELARHANDFIAKYWPTLLSEQKEVVLKWLTDNALPDKLNQGVTNSYQSLMDYIGEQTVKDMADALSKEGHDVFDKRGNASLSKIRKVFLFVSAPEMNVNSVLTGEEFGKFDLNSKEGKAVLRQTAHEYLKTLHGNWIYNHHLDSQIEIRTRGIEEIIQWSADARKLQLLADIENIIATAVGVGTGFEVNGKLNEKPQVLNYFRLWNKANIDGVIFKFQVMIERDSNGLLHYDLILPAKEIAVKYSASPHDNQTVEYAINNGYVLDNTSIDLESQVYGTRGILNIFIFDENGNELEDKPVNHESTNHLASDDQTSTESIAESVESNHSAHEYLQAIIDGKTDVMADGFDDEFLAFVEKHEQDESLKDLLEQAVMVWQNTVLKMTEDIK